MLRGIDPPRATVLVADDDELVLRYFVRVLVAANYRVITATGGAQAAAILRAGGVDVVVSDIHMPGFSGIDLLREMRASGARTPVILVTADPGVESAIDAVELGALKYLPKPITPSKLRAAVDRGADLARLAEMRSQVVDLIDPEVPPVASIDEDEDEFRAEMQLLRLDLQPIVDITGRSVFGHEALLRSDAETFRGPEGFFGSAAKLGRVQALSRSVRRRAAAIVKELAPEHSLFVNLHFEDLLDDDLYDPTAPLSQSSTRVVLEITERERLEVVPDLAERVGALRKLGFRIAVDDVGAGWAGMNTIAMLQPAVVKLDMALVRGIDSDPSRQRLVGPFIRLLLDCEFQVVSEGVETAGEREVLCGMGCSLMQGYLFARPSRFPFSGYPDDA